MKTTNGLTIWDVFNEYADVRDDLEDILLSYECLQSEIGNVMDAIAEELETLHNRLAACDRIFRRYKMSSWDQAEEMEDSPF